MKKDASISIVVPIYNNEKFIDNCIKSLINQTYKNIEIILVDDGSTDNSLEICNDYAQKDSRIKVIHKKNAGVSAARNTGIENATGEYITFVDSDDWIEQEFIEYLYKLIVENNADMSLTPFPNKVTEISHNINTKIDNDYIEVWTGYQATINMLYYKIVISSWNKMFNLNKLKNNKINFNTDLAFGEGYEFTISSFQYCNKIAVGHKKLYNYRVDNANSVMTKFSKKLVNGSIEAQKCIKENLIKKYEKLDSNLEQAWKYSNWHTYCDCLNTIVGCNVIDENKDLYIEVKKICKRDYYVTFDLPILKKDKIKAILYHLNPKMTALIINKFRKRKFTNNKK